MKLTKIIPCVAILLPAFLNSMERNEITIEPPKERFDIVILPSINDYKMFHCFLTDCSYTTNYGFLLDSHIEIEHCVPHEKKPYPIKIDLYRCIFNTCRYRGSYFKNLLKHLIEMHE